MDLEIDQDAIFADLRARGIDYEGDDAWYLQHAAKTKRDRLDRLELEQRLADERDSKATAKAEEVARLSRAWEAGEDVFIAEFDRQLGLIGEPGTDLPGSSACSAESDPASVYPGEASSAALSNDEGEGAGEADWVREAFALPERKIRLPAEAWGAGIRIQRNKGTIRDFSRRLMDLTWNEVVPEPSSSEGKKIPFSGKALSISSFSSKKKEEETKKTERDELFHPVTPDRTLCLEPPAALNLPVWKKLPASQARSPEITEIVTGLRFASVAFGESACLDRWFSAVPDEEVSCLSIDLHGDAADRFLAGEKGKVGAALHRRLRRRLERDLGGVAMGAIWTHPHGAPEDHVRLFLVIRASCMQAARDVEYVDRGTRFYKTLVRHGVRISPDNMPLTIHRDAEEAYYGLPARELVCGLEVSGVMGDLADADLQEFTPEAGFLAQPEIELLAAKSHARWSHYVARHGLAKWFSAAFVQEIVDCLVLSPEHVRERQQLKEAFHSDKFKTRPRAAQVARLRLKQLELMELAPNGIKVYRGSPAQVAAFAVRCGEVLGDWFDSRHKGERGAKPLYEELRKLWRTAA